MNGSDGVTGVDGVGGADGAGAATGQPFINVYRSAAQWHPVEPPPRWTPPDTGNRTAWVDAAPDDKEAERAAAIIATSQGLAARPSNALQACIGLSLLRSEVVPFAETQTRQSGFRDGFRG